MKKLSWAGIALGAAWMSTLFACATGNELDGVGGAGTGATLSAGSMSAGSMSAGSMSSGSMSSGSASTGGGDPGHESRAFVGAGNVGASPNFKAINVFGQATEHGYSSSSPSFKAKGGLIGATGSSK